MRADPPPPKPAHWLDDFMLREGIARETDLSADYTRAEGAAEKSYKTRIAAGIAALVMVGLVAAVGYHYATGGPEAQHVPAPPAQVALRAPLPTHRPVSAESEMPAPDDTSSDPGDFPAQPVVVPPTAFSNWGGTLIISKPPTVLTKSEPMPRRPWPATLAKPAPAMAPRPLATPPAPPKVAKTAPVPPAPQGVTETALPPPEPRTLVKTASLPPMPPRVAETAPPPTLPVAKTAPAPPAPSGVMETALPPPEPRTLVKTASPPPMPPRVAETTPRPSSPSVTHVSQPTPPSASSTMPPPEPRTLVKTASLPPLPPRVAETAPPPASPSVAHASQPTPPSASRTMPPPAPLHLAETAPPPASPSVVYAPPPISRSIAESTLAPATPKSGTTVPAPVALAKAPPPPVPRVAAPLLAMLPVGTPLHLTIIYTPADPAEAARVASLTARLRHHVRDITSAKAAIGRVRDADVIYFFPDDRAGASQIAKSLAQVTNRTEPVVLVRTKALPRPGTVEIRLPLKDGKDLNNEIN